MVTGPWGRSGKLPGSLSGVVCALALMAAMFVLGGCHKWSIVEVGTTTATVRLDGLEAVAGSITEELVVIEAVAGEEADEDRVTGVVATFMRGDELTVLVDAEGMPLYSEDGRLAIRIGEVPAEDDKDAPLPICALVDRHLVLLPEDEPFEPCTVIALRGATTFSDFGLAEDEQPVEIDTELQIVDEIDGVKLVGPEGSIRYIKDWIYTDERTAHTSKVDGAEVYAAIMARGDEVSIVGEHGDYWIVSLPGEAEGLQFPALIEKWLVRLSTETAPEGRTGYAVYSCVVYDSAFMDRSIATPAVDTVIEVLDEFNGVAYVRLPDGTEGYLPAKNVTPTTNYVAPRKRSGGGGGGGGGSSSGGQDGGDISLSAFRFGATTSAAVLSGGRVAPGCAVYVAGQDEGIVGSVEAGPLTGAVLSAATPVLWALLDRGDAFHALSEDAEMGTIDVQLAGRIGWMEAELVRADADEAFAPLDLFCQAGAVIYTDHHRTKELRTCDRNDKVRVIDEYGDGYVVEYAPKDGETVIAYIAKSVTSATEIPAPVTPRRSGGGGGGSSSGGGGGQEWTDPVL